MRFRKKPVVIEAWKFKVEPPLSQEAYFNPEVGVEWQIWHDEKGYYLTIPTLEGDHRADEGDWIIKGVKGEFYPCKSDVFEMTYEEVVDRKKGPQDQICDHCGQYWTACRC
jgi:hypothetical protein